MPAVIFLCLTTNGLCLSRWRRANSSLRCLTAPLANSIRCPAWRSISHRVSSSTRLPRSKGKTYKWQCLHVYKTICEFRDVLSNLCANNCLTGDNQETDLTAVTNRGMHSYFSYGGGVCILYPPSLWCIMEWDLWSMKVWGKGWTVA